MPWPPGYARHVVAEAPSTMEMAADLPGPGWVLALRQTAGRGRRGRAWADPPGNFAASVQLRPDAPPDQAALRSFAVALALRDALIGAGAPAQVVALKWPNDVLLAGGKVAGILLEARSAGARVDRLIVGVGVNLAHAPPPTPDAAFPPVSLADHAPPTTPEAFLDRLAPLVARREATLAAEGFAPIRADWLSAAARLGQPIAARTGTATARGVFSGVDDGGNLILDTADGRRRIAAAEVHF